MFTLHIVPNSAVKLRKPKCLRRKLASFELWSTKVSDTCHFFRSTIMKFISYQISTNELYLINSGISGQERERERGQKRYKFEFQNILYN